MKKYTIMFASHPDYSGNAKALYEYIKKKYKNMDLCWTIYDIENSKYLENNKINYVVYNTEDFEVQMQKTDIVFFTHDELIHEKLEGQIFIYLGHGNGSKKIGRMIDKDKLAPGDNDYLYFMKKNIDYIICSSELYRVLYSVVFDVDYDRFLPLGNPRTDYVSSKESSKKLNLVVQKDLSSFDKILMYLPTFRSGLGREGDGAFSDNVFNLEKYDEEILNDYLVKNNYLLLIKYHPYETNREIKIKSDNVIYLEEENLTKNLISLTEIIGAVDLMIADYSSAYSDFVVLNKPVCFLQNDLKEYSKGRGIVFNNADIWCPGPGIKTIQELKEEVSKLLEDETYYAKERQAYTNLVFENHTKDICKNICKTLFESKFKLLPKKSTKEEELIAKDLQKLKKDNQELSETLAIITSELSEKNIELDRIYKSKGWKLLEKIRKLFRR